MQINNLLLVLGKRWRNRTATRVCVTCHFLLSCAGCPQRSGTGTPSGVAGTASIADESSANGQSADDSGEFKPTEQLIEQHNRGFALMGRFAYSEALDIFAKLVVEHPEWTAAKVDLAIATLNRRQPGDHENAEAILDEVLQSHPYDLRAAYCRAILFQIAGDSAGALPLFRRVAEADPKDAYALDHIGQCLMDESKLDEALGEFYRAQQVDPYLRSAYYHAFQAAQRLRRKDEAKKQLEQFQKLATNPQARLAEIKYMRMGPKAEVRPIDFGYAKPAVRPSGPVFADPQPLTVRSLDGCRWRGAGISESYPSVTVCDIDADGGGDLFIAGAVETDNGCVNAVLLQREGDFELDPHHDLAKVSGVNAALWGDYDNDGLTDVYLCRRGPNQLWRQVEPGKWQDVTESTKTSGGDLNTVDGAIFDADHDGDLDLLLANDDGPNELLNNNLDGTFRALAQEQGLAGDGRPSRGVVVADLDNDRDADLVIIKKEPPHEVYLNDRLWSYHPAEGFDAFRETPIVAALAVDTGADEQPEQVTEGDWLIIEAAAAEADVDGQLELVTLAPQGVVRWAPDVAGTWMPRPIELDEAIRPSEGPLAIQDVDGDGQVDVIFSTSDGWSAAHLRGASTTLFQSNGPQLCHWTLAVLDQKRGPSLIGIRSAEPPLIWEPGAGRFPFAALAFTGREDKAEQMRTNVSGIGVRFAVRVGGQFTALDTFRQHSGPGQSLQPVAVGMGPARRMDFVRVTWPDGVFQTELDLAAGMLHEIQETQRQVSSCPVVFAWNGQKYEFTTDVLGVGGIGFNVGAGEYPEPRPWENLLLPQNLLEPRDGAYQIKVAEPMEEACYLDAARLVAYDLPPGWRMSLDERFAGRGPLPTGQPVLYRNCVVPVKAINDRDKDVTRLVKTADSKAAPPGRRDRRFIGRTDEHTVTLTFDQPLDAMSGQPVLLFNGWVEYPYSQTMFAAWQANADYEAPTVEARGADGRWHLLLDRFGYMAGMPREASVPLPKERLPQGTTHLRIRTNMEVYWDRFAVADTEHCEGLIRRELPLVSALAGEVGFAERTTLEQRLPYYDYDRRLPMWDTLHQAGFYTRFGTVTPLVNHTDDAVAIIGPGEEVHLEFDATLEDVPLGWTRRFVLETEGWCKDADLYTKDGETIAPLPRRHNAPTDGERREQLHREYNTRYRSGG